MQTQVDFSYAFATPHRLTVALPDSSHKTLLDLQPGSLRVAWTYDDLRRFPLAAFATPVTTWEVRLTPKLDGHPFARSTWRRVEGCLPALVNEYTDARGRFRIEAVAGATAVIIRVEVANTGDRRHRFSLPCERPGGWSGYNPAWVDPEEDAGVILAGWQDRADRVLILALGDGERGVHANAIELSWELDPGESTVAWLVRPYEAYAADLPALRAADWAAEMEVGRATWRALLARASRVEIPDPGVRDGFLACLADLFIMREPLAGGYIGGIPGTEGYRAANPGEPLVVSVALDQLGLHEEAELGQRVCLDQQGPDGNWSDPLGWGHLFWAAAGFKAWAVIEHYRLTRDRDYLERVYPRLAAAALWLEGQRARTRNSGDPLTAGLMPRGQGDCGLKDGDDLYGVFLPHNIWAVYANRVAAEAAEILGKEDAEELRTLHARAEADLLRALARGAIQEEGYAWIPGVPGKTDGSRWGALNALFPCRLLPPEHELITGTLRQIESRLSPGGQPVNSGWLPDGMWVAITLDNVAEAHLVRGDGDAAAEYLLSTLNHGTPLTTWCEERGQEPGSSNCTGDRQHLWTPVAVVRYVRDALVMEEGDGLHLCRGAARAWLASGEPVGITGAVTHFGRVSYRVRYDAASSRVVGEARFPEESGPEWAVLHLRLPGGVRATTPGAGAQLLPDGSGIRWHRPRGVCVVDVGVG